MIGFITSKFYPTNHPMESRSLKHREQYVCGLGELLSLFMPNNKKAKFAFEILCDRLSNLSVDDVWCNEAKITFDSKNINNNKSRFTNYLTNRRDGEHSDISISGLHNFRRANNWKYERLTFFRMCGPFWCDFYRICQLADFPIDMERITAVLDKITPRISRKFSINVRDWMFAQGNGELVLDQFKSALEEDRTFKEKAPIRVLVVGTMSSGKSTLINALAGTKISQVKTTVCTSSVSRYCNCPSNDFVIYSDGNSYIASKYVDNKLKDFPVMSIRFYGKLSHTPVMLIDTPGVNFAYDQSHREMTEREMNTDSYDSIICVVNSAYMESEESKNLIEKIAKGKHKKVVFVLNQLDRFMPDDDSIEECLEIFKSILKNFKIRAEVIPFSARAAMLLKKCTKGEAVSDIENIEVQEFKKKLCDAYYDLGAYFTGKPSEKNDYDARTGLKYLESYILQLCRQ